jgi:ubiquinone/menaquinone biosynthesis C-methylase UbiE
MLFDDTERRKWQNPEGVLDAAGLGSGMTFIDIGCGRGFFTIPAAKIVGSKGRIFAIDINPINMTKLRENVDAAGYTNTILKTGNAEDLVLCDKCADIVFFGIVLHDFENPVKVLTNARSMLKQSGHLVDLDWKREQMSFGPPLQIRFNEEKARQLIKAAGFIVQSTIPSGLYHYLITAIVA